MLSGAYLIYGRGISEETAARIARASTVIASHPPRWLLDWIPSYNRIFIEYDSHIISCQDIARWARTLNAASTGERRHIEVPVVYNGPDLLYVSEHAGLDPENVPAIHASVLYRVYAVGFTPGFPFMAEVPEPLRVPRRPEPRKRVPPHSVGIAGVQTGIYPQESPGGWNLIGRTLVRVYDPRRNKPFLLQPGDTVRFVPGEGEPPGAPERLNLLDADGPALFRVLEPGLLTVPVDSGRFRAGRFGLARSGPLDPVSFQLANRLLGNDRNATVLEMNIAGPVLEALSNVSVAIVSQTISGSVRGRTLTIKAGEVLDIRKIYDSARAYLAIAGGIATGKFMGSCSPDLKGAIGGPLRAGDVLIGTEKKRKTIEREWKFSRPDSGTVFLRLLPGPQASREALEALTGNTFHVASGDRMGLRLDGAEVPGGELISEGVPIGSVQVPPGGAPMLLLSDRGTIGGYSKPAVLHPHDLARAGQLRTGDKVAFTLESPEMKYCFIEI